MVAPKKGARIITVDGVRYRWRVRHKPTYSQSGWSKFSFSVEAADTRGSVLVVSCAGARFDSWVAGPGAGAGAAAVSMKPSRVAQVIRRALAAGWAPQLPGKPFDLADD